MARYAAVVVSLSALLFCNAAEAQYFGRNKVHYDRLEFRLLATEHFDIHYYAEEEEATRHAARMAERWYARFSRLLGHSFDRRQPLVLYASHPHFAQTNLIPGAPGEGTGGFTEGTRSRIAMPFAAGLGETDHVLGHEIAHAFQIDIARSVKQNAFTLPGWFIEGMAEYLSLGPANAHTTMWVRDAARRDRLPTLEQLDDPQYFPYRYGHALWSHLADRHGDAIVGRVLRSKARGGVVGRLVDVTGQDAERITKAWHDSVETAVDDAPASSGFLVDQRGRMQLAPALSPDGGRVMFLSERDRLAVDLFMADTVSGAVTAKIVSTAADPRFDSLQYIRSSGAWDAEGRRFAMAALRNGDPVLVIVDTGDTIARREIPLPGVREVYNPSWSPDGARIVVSGLKGGFSDLFVYTFATNHLSQLTADPFADLHPAWSPDGSSIAFATDRFATNLTHLRFGPLRVGLIDMATMQVRPLTSGLPAASGAPAVKEVNPQWAPDGDAIYFVSDRDGISNVYLARLAGGGLRQVTDVETGVSGITAASPALAVASRSGTLAFSVYENGEYIIRVAPGCGATEFAGRTCEWVRDDVAAAVEDDREAPPHTLDGADPVETLALADLLADATQGLPDVSTFSTREYDDRLQLESIAQPFLGATTGNAFGGLLRASVGATFADLLRDRQLQTVMRIGTDIDDFAAQMTYTNRREQWNWGVTAGFVPARFYGARRAIVRGRGQITRETTSLRYMHQWAGFAGRFNIDRARRIEVGAGLRRTGFTWQTLTRVTDLESRDVLSRTLDEANAGRPLYLAETQLAFVHDTAVLGPTSPVLGERLRLEIEPALGSRSFLDVRVDARKYLMPRRPVTIAARIEHAGRYGAGASDPRLTPLVVGLQTLVRGYDLRNFAADQCGRSATECSVIDELASSRLAVANLEVRAPLVGLFTGDLDYGRVPIEAIAFADAGFLWTRAASGGTEYHRFRSVGAGGRANLGGFVLELAAARPFDRSQAGWTVSFLLRPGW
jgi:Tol biopolymer transport system component